MEKSSELIIPPSANWFLSCATDCHRNTGVLAYAASRCLVLVWPENKAQEGVTFPKTRVVSDSHRQKITCVSWHQESKECSLILSTAGEDGRVCIWRANDQALLLEHNAHHNQKVVCLSWSASVDKKILASSSDDGQVVITEIVLNYESCSTRKLNFGKINPQALSFNPHNPYQIAIGCKGGLLLICDTRDKRGITHKLRGHEEDIHNVVWCPVKGNKFIQEYENTQEAFLATSGRDRTIKIWSSTEGKCIAQSKLPLNTGIHRPKSSQQEDRRSIWVALHWLNEKCLLSSGLSGELLSWEIEGTKLSWKVVHKLHSRGLFNISSFASEQNETLIWTSAQDRNVILWPLLEHHVPKEVLGVREEENPWFCIPTAAGFAYALSMSSIDSSHMAIGMGDGSIRIWNMAAAKPNMSMLWNGIKGKVTSLAWHPTVEGQLAFGTDEGRIGIFDTLNSSKSPLLSRTYHKGSVYNLGWAPQPDKEGTLSLYSCGGNHILIHDPAKLEAEAKNFNRILAELPDAKKSQQYPSRTEFQWKQDYSQLAVGNEDGSVEIYCGSTFSLVTIIVAHKKLIQCLRWHPMFTFQSAEPSACANWLAIASNDTSIKVYDIVGSSAISTLVNTLSGHKERVVSVAWNPHQDAVLLSASYDGTAQVWNVKENQALSNFGEHGGRLFCCEWSHLEPDTAITGSEDLTVRRWRVKDQIYKTPAESLAVRRSLEKKRDLPKPTASSVAGPDRHSGNAAGSKKGPGKLKSLFPISAVMEGRNRTEGLKDCKILATLKGIPLKHSVLDENPESYKFPADNFGQDHLFHLGFFCDQAATLRLLEGEEERHIEDNNMDLAAHVRMWHGDAVNMRLLLTEAAKKKQLNDFLLSLAPQVSIEFWREMSQIYAEQLLAEGDIRKAVSYAMISGQKSRAIEMFSGQLLHREAFALSRCQYPDDSSEVHENFSFWANKAIQDGNLELAVKCLLGNGNVAEAARVLARRANPASLKLAADLASNAGLDQLALAYLNQAEEMRTIVVDSSQATVVNDDQSNQPVEVADSKESTTDDMASPQIEVNRAD